MLYNISIFIFRRDLRLSDNTGLISALKKSNIVIPIFIFTPTQVSDENKFKSSNAIQFMVECLIDLNKRIKEYSKHSQLFALYGDEVDVINTIYRSIKFNAIFFNEDYTPYALKRDKRIMKWCNENNIACVTSCDILLSDTMDIMSGSGSRYKVFGQFRNKFMKEYSHIRKPQKLLTGHFINKQSTPDWMKNSIVETQNKMLLKRNFYIVNNNILEHGGRTDGLKILNNLSKFKKYERTRDIPALPTTHLSPHNKFGTVSVREVWFAIKEKTGSKTLAQQLIWRDFYYYVGYHFPELYNYQHLMHPSDYPKWEGKKSWLKKWQDGKTGIPIVDAAMTELNTTGFMHNRCRMIVAMFLTKDLLINWKYGERYFSQKLIDVDRAQNVGNWNWSSSFGLDHSAFLRIFNPWTQSLTFDPDCEYIKKWLPELKLLDSNTIHKWCEYYKDYPNINYPKPIVNHDVQRNKFIAFYKKNFK